MDGSSSRTRWNRHKGPASKLVNRKKEATDNRPLQKTCHEAFTLVPPLAISASFWSSSSIRSIIVDFLGVRSVSNFLAAK